MKKFAQSVSWILIFFMTVATGLAQINTPSGATKPFGSNTSYEYGIMPTNLPSGNYGGSKDAATAYTNWKSKFVENCGSDKARVKFDTPNETVSEGIAYGMLLSAYAADKNLFDRLWTYYKANSNGRGVMNWKINGCSGASGQNGATDAELDAAMALIVAEAQWPSSTSPYNYKSEAATLISKIRQYEIHPTSYQTINGDAWGFNDLCRNPSYFSPAYYKEYAKIETNQLSFWNSAISESSSFLLKNRNASTGLVSNWSDPNASANGCNGPNEYGYDACRNPWRMANDVLWNGASATAASKDICNKLTSWTNGYASQLKGPLSQSASNPGQGQYKNGVFTTYALAVMGTSSTYQSHLNSCYTNVVNIGNNEPYFGATLRTLSLFVLTGNFWKPGTTSNPNNSKPTVSLTAPAAGLSVCEGTSITISANAADSDGSIAKVEFYNGATLLGVDNSSPYSYTWTNATAGNKSITARAYDNSNANTPSSARTITIKAAPNKPTVVNTVNYEKDEIATKLTATGTSLKWYTSLSGGTSLPTAPTPFTTNSGTTNYYVSQTVNGCESSRATIKVVVGNATNAINVERAEKPIQIDGNIDNDWNSVEGHAIENKIQGAISGSNDLSGVFKLLWDANNLYVLGDITDDIKKKDSPEVYNDDAVEIYLDFGNKKANTYSNSSDAQYTFRWDDNTIATNTSGSASTSGIVFKMKASTKGYVFEAKIPWAVVGGSGQKNTLHGFDFHVNDDDDGGERDGKLAWFASLDEAWKNPSLFGSIKLLNVVSAASDDLFINSISTFPNPFSNTIKINGLKGETNYLFTDISGRVIQSGITTGVVETDFEPGTYHLILDFGERKKHLKLVKVD